MAQCTTRWFLSLQITLYLFLIFVQGNEDADDAYKNGRSLVLEYFLPINLPTAVNGPLRREKRDVEGSGEDESTFSELNENVDVDNSTQNELARLVFEKQPINNVTTLEEGSGEIESSEEHSSVATLIIDDSEVLTTSENSVTENQTQETLTSTEMVFDRSEDFDELKTETTTIAAKPTTTSDSSEESTTAKEETTTDKAPTTTEETTAGWATESITVQVVHQNIPETTENPATTTVSHEVPDKVTSAVFVEETTVIVPTAVPEKLSTQTVIDTTTIPQWITTPKFIEPKIVSTTIGYAPVPETAATTSVPVVEEVFKETRMDEKLEASPGNILKKENLSLGADPLLITNTRLIDSEETVQLSSTEPKRLGAYIVIGLILLSFFSLVGYITFRKRMNRKRQEFESNPESHDTEKALLSLSDYKDSSELEENHLKNNEITPIVVKSNAQINKFEKNTNFSSQKNLNTIANEKNIEKDNVLKSTAENLTQVIIEDSPKDVDENVPSMEKLIVKTRVDQDSIPKKPIIINRSSTGYMPVPQDNS